MARHFGVEIEFKGVSATAVAAELSRRGVECRYETYNHASRTWWKVVTDASVRDGFELVSPKLLGEAGLSQLRTACEVLTELGAKVDRACGLHVHVDASWITLAQAKNLIKYWVKFENGIDTVLPPSRRGDANGYCKSVAGVLGDEARAFAAVDQRTTLEAALAMLPSRYHKLNLEAYWRHKTVEFRGHSGSTDPDKVCNWARFCVAFYEAATAMNAPKVRKVTGLTAEQELERIFKYAVKDPGLKEYYKSRQRKFAQSRA